jgi:hypothetical protein
MKTAVIDGVKVAFPDEMGEREVADYVAEQKKPIPSQGRRLAQLEILLCGNGEVELIPHYDTVIRVRRNPGYIGATDRLGEAKKAEERLRAAHMSTGQEE